MQVTLFRTAIAAALLGAGAAHADTIDTHAFTFGNVASGPADIVLLSDSATRVSFSLDGLVRELRSSVDSTGMPSASADSPAQGAYDLAVKDGYRITGLTITGTFSGSLAPAAGGAAGNEISLRFVAWPLGNLPLWSNLARVSDLDGEQGVSISTGSTSLQGELLLGLLGSVTAYADSGLFHDDVTGTDEWIGSQAQAGADSLVLTVDVAPVPEPQTWAMLLGGMAGLGAWRRRLSAARNAAQQ